MRRLLIGDMLFCAALLAGGAVVLGELAKVPPAPFDPLGSAAVPSALAWIIIALAALVMARALVRLVKDMRGGASARGDAPEMSLRHGVQTAIITALTTVYVFAITSQSVPFSVSTAVLVAVGTLVLAENRWHRLPLIGAIALATGAGSEWLFTRVFYLPLPHF
ncbi:tripartite tricarboxylate transporter TctB family protein [Mesorhizobium sp. 1B3]|uniref:tripartite tricarboxylate transporter TctB family protein n=1 Tax=Mesorhizobium sp. 1B3 TaxID=3243599 RepID=UPI003D99B26A